MKPERRGIKGLGVLVVGLFIGMGSRKGFHVLSSGFSHAVTAIRQQYHPLRAHLDIVPVEYKGRNIVLRI